MEFADKSFYDPIEDSLRRVQDSFDHYQNAKFPVRTAEFFCLELCGEAGELANLCKKAWKGRDIEYERFADEAADVLIALMNFANAKNINLGEAVVTKLQRIEIKRQELERQGREF